MDAGRDGCLGSKLETDLLDVLEESGRHRLVHTTL